MSTSSLVQNVDIEMKFLAVVIPFALVKFLGASYNSWFWTNGTHNNQYYLMIITYHNYNITQQSILSNYHYLS